MLLAVLVILVTIAAMILLPGEKWWFPAAISDLARDYDQQFRWTLWIGGGIFVAAQLVLAYTIFRYRDRGQRPSSNAGNNKLEIVWTLATLVLFVGIMLAGNRIWARIHFDQPPADALQVEVSAKQFAWAFRYPGPDGKFGKTDLKMVNDAIGKPFGIDDKDPAGKDDIVSASLKVPTGKSVVLTLIARDVIHNFFVRELRIKQDAVPGMRIPFHFQADKTGTYEIACSELCGLGHHQMRSTMQVMSPEGFDEWLKEQLALK